MNMPAFSSIPAAHASGTLRSLVMCFGNLVERLAWWVCMIGGLLLLAATAVTLLSIVSRTLAPIFGTPALVGDVEIMEIACAIAGAAFLPWCQVKKGHVVVAIVVDLLPPIVGRIMVVLSDIGLLVFSGILARALWQGMSEKKAYFEVTMMLELPLWMSYAAAFAALAVFVLACCATLLRTLFNIETAIEEPGYE